MSQFLSKKFPSIESFYSDITQLGKGLHANEIRLCGGEPLLNPEINSFIEIAKKAGIADQVSVTTNGLVLHKMNDDFWENVDSVVITLYPKVHLEEKLIEEFKRYAKQSNTDLTLFPNPSFRTTIVTQPHPKDLITDLIFKTCDNVHLHHCHTIHEGKLYKCAVPPFLPEYLAKMGMAGYDPAQDAFDIHKAKDIFHELKAFLLSSDTMEACRYCLGYLGKSQAHCQLKPEVISDPSLDKITRKEYFDLHKLHKLLEDLVESGNDGVKEFGITKISEKVTNPRCSVIIPTYNRSRYLPKAINSVLSQTFQDFEIIVVDDCSTDNTVQIIQEFVKHDSRIKLLRHERNKGAQAARNTGIVNSTAEYVAFLDSDDEWLPERLRLGFEVIEAEAVPVVHSEAIIHKNGQNALKNIPPLRGYIYPKILNEPGPMFQGLLLKKECLEKIGLLDETIISWQEWDTFIRLAKYFEFGFVSEPCFIWHWHEGHTISDDKRKEAEGYYQIVEKHADEIIKYAGTEALMNHYMITLERLKALTAYEKFQQVKVKLKTLIDREKNCFKNRNSLIEAQLGQFENCSAEERQSFYDENRNYYEFKERLIELGVPVKDIEIDINDFEMWRKMNPAMENSYKRLGDVFIEKLLEHYLTYTLLEIKVGDVFIDVAASGSPWADTLSERGIESYRLDLSYERGINGRDIGANASDTKLPDNFASVLTLHCAYECFMGDADRLFIKEAERILKNNGRFAIVPLYFDPIYLILTSPYCDQGEVIIDPGAKKVWRDDKYKAPFSRHYSPEVFVKRIYSKLNTLKGQLYFVNNIGEIQQAYPDQKVYCYFTFVGRKNGVSDRSDTEKEASEELCAFRQNNLGYKNVPVPSRMGADRSDSRHIERVKLKALIDSEKKELTINGGVKDSTWCL